MGGAAGGGAPVTPNLIDNLVSVFYGVAEAAEVDPTKDKGAVGRYLPDPETNPDCLKAITAAVISLMIGIGITLLVTSGVGIGAFVAWSLFFSVSMFALMDVTSNILSGVDIFLACFD